MLVTVLIVFFSLIFLIILHELGHFLVAKKFGVKVEEFGIFLPPRIFAKRIGQTLYSLNLLPLGAFVKLHGETGEEKTEYWSFTQKPVWQRALIVLGGVVSFWIVSTILFTLVMGFGVPTIISDEESGKLRNPKVQVISVTANSPAEFSGIRAGDTIINLKSQTSNFRTDKVREVQEFVEINKGKEITLTIERGKEVFEVSLIPRFSPPEREGPMGVVLVRTAIKNYPWYQAPIRGVMASYNLTIGILKGWARALVNLFRGQESGVQLVGPVGIFNLFLNISQLGLVYFLQFLAVISIYLALFNILPIPALDGGKLVFLTIEAVRRKPLSPRIEQNITTFFFALLIALIIWVTIKDITRLF